MTGIVNDNILVLAPHTDDAELGCGGTIARFVEEGRNVSVAALSNPKESLPHDALDNTLELEFRRSMNILGVPPSSVFLYDYPVRRLGYHRQELLDELLGLGRKIPIEVVLIPSGSDLHQDHQVLFAEAVRAFKRYTILGYELPWNHVTFSAHAFVRLEAKHVEKKVTALSAYQSQLDLNRPYFAPEFTRGLAQVRGVQVGSEYAEAYEVVRLRI